ncbi:MAG: DUF108 domain-containing protein [Candidatus Omnitrophica bacterium]|nr:DUF108 domain-containing protein [Candidatus Omnitrophota bacterium]
MKLISVGIIGLGAIGSRLVEILTKEFHDKVRVDSICDIKEERIEEIQGKWAPRAKSLPWPSLVARSDVVIEAASQEIALSVAKEALKRGKQVLILSVGGLLAWNGLSLVLKKTKGKLWIPSGALAGVDGVLAANEGRIHKVTLTTRKPLAGLAGAPYLLEKRINLSRITKPTLIFEGNAAQATRAFPQNVNVAATLALAGIGSKRTLVRILTSPTYKRNQHEVEIEGDFGSIRTVVENFPSKRNPRTSELAVLSSVATLKKIFGHLHIGT